MPHDDFRNILKRNKIHRLTPLHSQTCQGFENLDRSRVSSCNASISAVITRPNSNSCSTSLAMTRNTSYSARPAATGWPRGRTCSPPPAPSSPRIRRLRRSICDWNGARRASRAARSAFIASRRLEGFENLSGLRRRARWCSRNSKNLNEEAGKAIIIIITTTRPPPTTTTTTTTTTSQNLTGIKLPSIFHMLVELVKQVFDEHILDFVTSKKLVFLIEHLLYGVGEPFVLPEHSLCI